MRRRALTVLLAVHLALGGVVVPALAHAQTKAELAEARAKFQRATELKKAGDYAGALSLFREVGATKMSAQVRYNIADCEENLGKLVAALGGYKLALDDAATVGKGFSDEVSRRIQSLEERIPRLTLMRGDRAQAAKLRLDGTGLGETSIGVELRVDPGPHVVEAIRGDDTVRRTIRLEEGAKETVTLDFEAEPEPAAPPPAAEKKASNDVWPWVIGGVGVVSLGASGVFYLQKRSAMDDLDAVCGPNRDQCPASSHARFEDAKRYDTLATVTGVVGVVAVGTAVTLLLTGKEKKAPASAMVVTPQVGARAGGVVLDGRF